jgi:predicted PurR-regulated permease PerM
MKSYFNIAFLLGLLFLVGFGVYVIFKPFLIAILLAFIASQFCNGWYKKINKKLGDRKSLASLLICLIVLFIFIIPLSVVVWLVLAEASSLYQMLEENNWQEKIDMMWRNAVGGEVVIFNRSFNLQTLLQSEELVKNLKNLSGLTLKVLKSTYQGASYFFFMVFVMFFSLYYFLKDQERIVKRAMHLSPLKNKQEKVLIDKFIEISRATIKGSLVVAMIQGFLTGLSLWIAGVPSAVLLGVVAVVLSIIPMLGSGLVWLPVGIILLFLGQIWQGVFVIVFGSLIVGTIDNFLRPKLVGDSSSLHPLLVFFATIGGIAVFGLLGFLIGPIIVALFVALLDIYEIEFKEELGKFNH